MPGNTARHVGEVVSPVPDERHYTNDGTIANNGEQPQAERVTDLSGDYLRKYRTELPNIVDEMDLTPYEFRLYVHYKRVAGGGNTCNQGQRTIARITGMSQPTVSRARQGLAEKQLINIRPSNSREIPDEVEVVNIWEKNFNYFRGDSQVAQGDSEGIGGDSQVAHKKPTNHLPPYNPPLNASAEEVERHLQVEECADLLLSTPTFKDGWNTAVNIVRSLSSRYPTVDPVTVVSLYQAKHLDGMTTQDHPARLRRYFEREARDQEAAQERARLPRETSRKRKGSATPAPAVEEMKEYWEGPPYRPRHPLLPYLDVANDFDFTSDQVPGWKIMSRLGGDKTEQNKNYNLMRSIAINAMAGRESDGSDG